jgi:pentatricopeptide repeat protein
MPDVPKERLEHLEHEARRLACLLKLWTLTTGDDVDDMLEMIDDMLDRGLSPESLHRYAAKRRRRRTK